ncbi:transposase, partial [Enterococcus faecium]|nr:transposase [Enterococcus faecium]
MLKAFKFRMYPTEEQKQQLIRTFGCARFTYNHLLKKRQKSWQQTGVANFSLTPATLKKEYPFLKEVDSLALANAQLNLDRAFRNYFKGRASFPKLKTKKSMWQSYTTNNQTRTIYLENGYLKLPKQKELIKINQHRPVEGSIRSATISARYNEEFYVALLCDVSPVKKESLAKWIGIAYHPKTLIQTSRPLEVTLPKFHQTEEKLQHAQRKLNVKVRSAHHRKIRLDQASNYQKQKRKV